MKKIGGKPMEESHREVSLNADFGSVVINLNGSGYRLKVTIKQPGEVDNSDTELITSQEAVIDGMPCTISTALIKEPEIGDKMPDGTIYAGISPDTGEHMYTLPLSVEPGTMTWDQADKYISELEAHGHSDWRLPAIGEAHYLFINKDKGYLKNNFPDTPCPEGEKDLCWTSTDCARAGAPEIVRVQFFGYINRQVWLYKDDPGTPYPVRTGPAPT
jgi:hypothetical protein